MGYVETITVDLDRERQFIVSFGTIRRFQKASGKTFKDLGQLMQEAQVADGDGDEEALVVMIGHLLWAGCVSDDPSVTVDQIFDGLSMNPAEQLLPIFEAIKRAMPEADEDSPLAVQSPPDPPSRSAKTGGRSGRSGARS